MRSNVPAYEMEAPATLAQVLQRMAQEPQVWKPFAGGTDLMVLLEAGKLQHRKFLSIWRLPELRGIEVTPSHITLGSLTTYSEVRRQELLAREFPLLCRAASEAGSIATQNRGTIGGNLANASPAADFPPTLLVYDAQLELVSSSGLRWVACRDFWKAYKQIDLRSDELIRGIRLPRQKNDWIPFYRKVGARRAQAISKVCFAAAARMDAGIVTDLRIALGSVAPTVLRAMQTESVLRGNKLTASLVRVAQETLAKEIAPIDDIRSTARYRLRIAQNLLAEFCERLTG